LNDGSYISQDKQAYAGANRIVYILSGLLIVQFGLAVLLKFAAATYQPIEPTAKLLTFDPKTITTITIEVSNHGAGATDRSKVLLQKGQNGWILPGYYNMPASQIRMDWLFEMLKSLKKGFPISTTSGAAERFSVSQDKFERAISLVSNDKKTTVIYFGTCPSFRTFYTRVGGSNDIYSLPVPLNDLSGRYRDWFNSEIIERKPEQIIGIDMGNYKIEKAAVNWNLSDQGHDHPISGDVADKLLDQFGILKVASVLGTKEDPAYNADHPVLSAKLNLKGGKLVTYSFFKPKAERHYVLKTSDQDYFFEIEDWYVKHLMEVTPASLLAEEAEQAKRREPKRLTKNAQPKTKPQAILPASKATK